MQIAMIGRETAEFYSENLNEYERKEYLASCLEGVVNLIILSLYDLDEELIIKADEEKLKTNNLWLEPVNWGHLSCVDVSWQGGTLIATIEEADPNAKKFHRYILFWLRNWGWNNVVIRTVW